MASKKMRHVRGKLISISSQRVEYKPYNYVVGFGEAGASTVIVDFEIPEDTVLEPGMDTVTIDLAGLNAILEVFADSIDLLNQKHIKKLQS